MPDIVVNIGGNNSGLLSIVNNSIKALRGVGSSANSALAPLMKFAAPVIGLVGLGAGCAGVTEAIKGTLDKGRDLQEVMLRTGQAANPILKLQSAFRASRLEADQVGPSINKLQKALAGVNEDGEDTSSIFAQLGIDVDDLKTEDAAGQFSHLGQMLLNIKDPAEKTAAVMKIFGKSGGEMLQLFSNSSQVFGLLDSKLSGSQALLAQNAALYQHITTLLDQFIFKAKSGFGLFAGITAGAAPLLDRIANILPNIDLAGLGKQIGAIPGLLVTAFQTGHLGELISLAFQMGVAKAAQFMVQLGPVITAALEPIAPHFGRKFENVMIDIADFAFGVIAGAVEAVLSLIYHAPALIKASFQDMFGLVQLVGASLMKVFTAPVQALRNGLTLAVEELLQKLSKIPAAAKLFGLQDYKAESYAAIAQRNQPLADKSDQTAERLGRAADANLNKATGDMWSAVKGIGSGIAHDYLSGYNAIGLDHSGDGADPSKAASDSLASLVAKLGAGTEGIYGQLAQQPQGTESFQSDGKADKKSDKKNDALEDEKAEIEIMRAKSAGQDKLAAQLQRELDIRRETARLIGSGASAEDAKKLATQKADLTPIDKEKSSLSDKDEDPTHKPGPVQTHASSLANAGGGGYSRGGSLQSIQTASMNYLKEIAAELKRKKTLPTNCLWGTSRRVAAHQTPWF